MPRLQILELPEGIDDERPPFVLVIDQAPRDEPLFRSFREDMDLNDIVADRVGARAVLVFEDTIDIPANEVPIGPDGHPVCIRLEPDLTGWDDAITTAVTRARERVNGTR
ncbi:hypothetical protein [Streptomyces sp. NPDC047315]|uniref:hypothetical protein n=1 Tax=Streptomyces sp. NPDC047315 TaxID=3155142 RepID=UPI0033DD2C7D